MSMFSKKWLFVLAIAPCACSASNKGKTDDGGANPSQSDSGDSAITLDGGALEDGGSSMDGDTPTDAQSGEEAVPFDTGGSPGHVVVRMPDGNWHRIAATPSPTDENLATALGVLSAGNDQYASLSLDGAWLGLNTGRFGCADTNCVALVNDLSSGALVPSVRSDARLTVAPGGGLVVYPASGGPHALDLYAIRRSGNGWGAPRLLTASMTAQFAHDPAFSFDGTRVVFDCGPSQYQDKGSICEAAVDGSGFRVVVAPTDGPGGTVDNETHHPAYAPDGSIVFEADWQGGEQVWRIAASGGAPVRISPPDVTDDNSPCVLPDGRIASLWLGRPENVNSLHELKVMNPDGSGAVMLVTGIDIVDVGESCGN